MKQIIDYRPSSIDDLLFIETSSEHENFPTDNLRYINPSRVWKSNDLTETTVKYGFGSVGSHGNFLFLNRVNFSSCILEKSDDDITWVEIEDVDDIELDEIYDETYAHRGFEIEGEYRYLRLTIPAQTPLFNVDYYQIGNMLVGDAIEIWNPKPGYSINQMPKRVLTEYDSGFISDEKVGKTRRQFSGQIDKIDITEFKKIALTYKPFVLYHEFDNNPQSVYLVRSVQNYSHEYFQHSTISLAFNLQEMV